MARGAPASPGNRWNFPLQILQKWHRILQSLNPLGTAISACHQIHFHWCHKDGAELPRMLGGADSSQSWQQHGIIGWLGDVDLMGLGCGFMYGLGFWLLVRNPNQKSLFPESPDPEGVRNPNQRSLFQNLPIQRLSCS